VNQNERVYRAICDQLDRDPRFDKYDAKQKSAIAASIQRLIPSIADRFKVLADPAGCIEPYAQALEKGYL